MYVTGYRVRNHYAHRAADVAGSSSAVRFSPLHVTVLAVRSAGLIKANEEFAALLRGDRSMPFGRNHEHTTIRLIVKNLENNRYVYVQSGTLVGTER